MSNQAQSATETGGQVHPMVMPSLLGGGPTERRSALNDLLSVFAAEYSRTCWGETSTRGCIVVANTEAEALGLLMESETDTNAEYWTLTRIDQRTPASHYITGHN